MGSCGGWILRASALAAASAVSCTLFNPLGSYGDRYGDTCGNDCGAPDARSPSDASGLSDTGGSVDAGPTDTGGPADTGARSDSGTDGANPSEGGSDAGWCVLNGAGHTFCSDFDEPDATGAWSNVVLQSGGVIALDSTLSQSAPDSLLATIPAQVGSPVGELRKTFASTPTGIVVDLDLFAAMTGSTSAAVLTVQFPDGYELTLDLKDTALDAGLASDLVEVQTASDAALSYTYNPLALLPRGTWTHIRLTASFTSSDAGLPPDTVEVEFNGVDAGAATIAAAPGDAGCFVATGVRQFAPAPSVWGVNIDNVTIDLH